MAVERSPSGSSLIDVLDRVLDKGIVIDAWVRVSLVGIDLITVEARSSTPSGVGRWCRLSSILLLCSGSAHRVLKNTGGSA